MLKWLRTHETCPLCRAETSCDLLIYVCNEEEKSNLPNTGEAVQFPTKPERIVEILKARTSGKAIVFSEEDATYSIIKKNLLAAGIACGEIRGTVNMRDKMIQNFKEGKPRVLFLNAKNNGAGINLQECTDIVLYHKMNESTKTQIMGRANRIGRYEELFVHQLEVQCSQT